MEVHEGAKRTLVTGALIAGVGVGAGAWGAHGLRAVISPEMIAVFETAVRYQMYHAFGLIAAGIVLTFAESSAASRLRQATVAFIAGIVLFSGSLYVLALTGISWVGAITPLGGLSFLAGWVLFADGCRRLRPCPRL